MAAAGDLLGDERRHRNAGQGDPVVELETEKVNYELDSPVEGVLLKIVSREPAEVPVGGLLGYIGKPDDVVPNTLPSS